MSDDAGGTKDENVRGGFVVDDERPSEDPEILQAVRDLQDGDERAAEVLFRRYYPPLLRFFKSQPHLAHEADDLAQLTLERAFRKIDQFRFESLFHTWLRRIGENVWKNADRYHRAIKRDAPTVPLDTVAGAADDSPDRIDSGRTELEELGPGPEAAALARESVAVLQSAMAELPPGMRHFMELRVVDELSYSEIAEQAGVTTGTVKSQLFEARKRLQPLLRDYFGDPEL